MTIERRKVLFLQIFERDVKIECSDVRARELLCANYSALQTCRSDSANLEYTVTTCQKGFCIARPGSRPLMATDGGEFLFLFEKDLTIELEKLRHDLYFVHGAALGFSRGAFLLVAPSGKGKSTTTWALLHHGFQYLSDELAPLNLDTLEVLPYPHALCLKKEPPYRYSLPDKILRIASTLHIPTQQLPNATFLEPLPLRVIFFLDYQPGLHSPAVRPLSRAETAARLFTQALNPLAHTEDGLAGAVAIARKVPSFRLDSGDLRLTCDLINETLERAGEANVSLSA
jgi:hypothetical protein